MQKRIGVITPYSLGDTATLKTRKMVEGTTENIGNLMFRYAAANLFPDHVPLQLDLNRVEEYRDIVDCVVYPTANQLNPAVKGLSYHTKFFKSLNLPVVMIGLGAQSNGEDISKKLSDESVRFFQTISGISNLIGVRGSFTQEMLSNIGIDNTVIIGCPSNFINDNASLGVAIEAKLSRATSSDLTRVSFFPQHGISYTNEQHRPSEVKLFEWASRMRGGSYIVNGPFTALTVARGRAYEASVKDRKHLAQFFMPGSTIGEFERQFRGIARVIPHVEALMEHLSQDDLVIGKRIHGAFAATQAETPAVVIAHDARTKELAITTATPYISLNDFEKVVDIHHIPGMIAFSGAAYDETRRRNYSKFLSLFTEVKRNHIDKLLAHPLAPRASLNAGRRLEAVKT